METFTLFKVFSRPGMLFYLHLLSEPCSLQALASGPTPFLSSPLCPMICDHHLLPGPISRICPSMDSNDKLLSTTRKSLSSLWGNTLSNVG